MHNISANDPQIRSLVFGIHIIVGQYLSKSGNGREGSLPVAKNKVVEAPIAPIAQITAGSQKSS